MLVWSTKTPAALSTMAPFKESALAGIGAALGFLALYATSLVLPMLPGDVKVMCPPLGAVAVLLFCLCALRPPPPSALCSTHSAAPCVLRPKAPASSTYAVIIGHLVGGAVAVTVNQFLAKGDPMAPGVAVALAIFGMKLLDCVHPPAAACASPLTAAALSLSLRLP